MTDYKPKPEDTSQVVLSTQCTDLAEQLAKHAHDIWAKNKVAEGWVFGEELDPDGKRHPDSIPYEDLSAVKQKYDLDMALGTVKLIIKKGYEVSKLGEFVAGTDPKLEKLDKLLQPGSDPDLDTVLHLWRTRDQDHVPTSADVHLRLGKWLIKKGKPLNAHDVLSAGLEVQSPEKLTQVIKQQQALALMRSGGPARAQRILKDLDASEETLGLLASCKKIRWEQATDPEQKATFLKKAFRAYRDTYRSTGGYWTGINTATLALMMGDEQEATKVAAEVEARCTELLPDAGGEAFWILATLGEACLVQKRWDEAKSYYQQATARAATQLGELARTRRNAQLIVQAHGDDVAPATFDGYVPVPHAVVFAGHMIDRPDRPVPRFPASIEQDVRKAIEDRLEEHDCRVGYAGASCGADILFHEAIRNLGGESYVVLPYDRDLFVQDCVAYPDTGDWTARFEKVLQFARDVYIASPHGPLPGGITFSYANDVLDGHARIKAAQFGKPLHRMVVWDGKTGDGAGGTHDLVRMWQDDDLPVTVIDTTEFLPSQSTVPSPTTPPAPDPDTRVMSMLFADAKGFSKLDEAQVTIFVDEYLGGIAKLLKSTDHPPVIGNTWGDGLYFVFDQIRHAGLFALELCDYIVKFDPTRVGLPETMSIRIGLHAGPVTAHHDAIIGQGGFHGTHISREARIEPITPPGQVYTSQQFAALAAHNQITEFTCEYVGQTQQAKKYGTLPTYHLRRTA